MKKYFSRFLILFAVAFTLHSCGSNNKEGAMIPATATIVSVMNLESMSEQLTWEEVKASGWYTSIKTNNSLPDWTKKVLGSPEESGINFKKNLLFFTNNTASGKTYMAFSGVLVNQKDFDQFNKQNSNAGDIKKQGNVSILSLSKNQLVGWNDDNFVYLASSDADLPSMGAFPSNTEDSNDSPLTMSELIQECNNIFALKKDNSLSGNKPFSALMKEGGDIRFYMNGEEAMKGANVPGLNMLNSDVFFKNNVTTMAIKFEKGEIEVKQRQYASKELMEFVKDNTGSKIDKAMISRIPSTDIMAIMALNLKPGAIQNLVKLTGADGIANMFLQQAGFNLDDVSKATDGNMMMVLSDAKATVTSSDSTSFKMDFNALLAMGVKDEPSFKKIEDGARKFLGEDNMADKLSLTLNNKLMVVSNSKTYSGQYIANDSKNKFDFLDKIDNSPMGVYVDLQKVIAFANNSSRPSLEKDSLVMENLKMWKNIIVSGGDVKNGAVEMKTEINLMDENTNSLKQLNSFFYLMSEFQKNMKSTTVTGKNIDSLLTAPVADTVRITDTPKL